MLLRVVIGGFAFMNVSIVLYSFPAFNCEASLVTLLTYLIIISLISFLVGVASVYFFEFILMEDVDLMRCELSSNHGPHPKAPTGTTSHETASKTVSAETVSSPTTTEENARARSKPLCGI